MSAIATVLQCVSSRTGEVLGELPIPEGGADERDVRAFIALHEEPMMLVRYRSEKPCEHSTKDAIAASRRRQERLAAASWELDSRELESRREQRHRETLAVLDRIASALEQSNKDYAHMVQRT